MNYETINWRVDGGILWLTLDRPGQLNAFTPQMADELEHAFRKASQDDEVAVIIVTGRGNAFCAGMDLASERNVFGLDESLQPLISDLEGRLDDPQIRSGVRDTGGRVTLAIFDCTKPVIAAINGAAVGIGATMTLAMDFRLASTKARIGFVFGRLGIVPEACSSWFLPRIVGISKALEWVYRADIIDPAEALDAGLLRSVHAPDDLLKDAEAFARSLTRGRSPVATALARQMMYRGMGANHPLEAHKAESLAMFYTSQGDGKEGVAAFLEKRPAHFTAKASQMPAFCDEWLSKDGRP